ncbi:MAG: HAMP domain-containing histidine kinase [Burkholderiales bacterium]|nr:HAMP domain-containing histidine kinase [Burkholderiales bacterium]
MRALYLRIYFTIVAALGLFALVSGWLVHGHLAEQRARIEAAAHDRAAAWGELIEHALPDASAPAARQIEALQEWSLRLRLPLALDDAQGHRLGASESFTRRQEDPRSDHLMIQSFRFEDGRELWVARRPMGRGPPVVAPRAFWPAAWNGTAAWTGGFELAALLVVLFIAVAAGSWPVVRRLTRRLELLKAGVEAFGAGALHQRVVEEGRDEVAAVAASFNRAAKHIETLVRSHQSLLANASHELRSPLARLKMAVTMMDEAGPDQRARLRAEIDTDISELDALVEEVLLASRLDAPTVALAQDPVDLLAMSAEEAARVQATASGDHVQLRGEERLLRRAVRNLLENARRYGGGEVAVEVSARPGRVEIAVADRGPGVPPEYRERIFEAFFRLPGHAETAGGVGLGLSLVRQIAARHGGDVRCEAREGGGSRFVIGLPLAAAPLRPA